MFALEVYGPCEYLPRMRLFESKVFTCTKVITQALLLHEIYYLSLIISAKSITRASLPYFETPSNNLVVSLLV